MRHILTAVWFHQHSRPTVQEKGRRDRNPAKWRSEERACMNIWEVGLPTHAAGFQGPCGLLEWGLGAPRKKPQPCLSPASPALNSTLAMSRAEFLLPLWQRPRTCPSVSRNPQVSLGTTQGATGAGQDWFSAHLPPRPPPPPRKGTARQTANIWPLGSVECEEPGIFSPEWKKSRAPQSRAAAASRGGEAGLCAPLESPHPDLQITPPGTGSSASAQSKHGDVMFAPGETLVAMALKHAC